MSRYGVDEAIGGLLDDALIGVDRRARAVEAASVAPTPRYGGSLSEDDDDVPLAARVGGGKRCLLYTSPSPRDRQKSRMPSSA